MPFDTDGDVAVVQPFYAAEEAYRNGYQRFEGTDLPDEAEFDLSGFRQSATYANTVLPRLRAMSGYADAGHGTYTENRKVAAVHPGCEEDTPAEADIVDATTVEKHLMQCWERGVYDAVEGREPDVGRCPRW